MIWSAGGCPEERRRASARDQPGCDRRGLFLDAGFSRRMRENSRNASDPVGLNLVNN